MRTNKISYLIIFMAIILLPFSVFSLSDTIDGDPPVPGPGVPPPPGLPIDNHLPLLLIAGLSLGIYFLDLNKTSKKVL